MKTSIMDIARHAGVSKSTVSRVINGGSVSEEARRKVEETMLAMGYSPNYMARGLRGVKNPVIGVLSPGGVMFADVTLSARFAGIVDTLQKQNYDLLLVHEEPNKSSPVPKYISYLQDQRIDGLITVAYTDLLQIKKAADLFRNVVYVGERIDPGRGFRIYLGNYNYSYDAYAYFMQNGHKRILTVSFGLADRERLVFNRRIALQRASEDYRIPCDYDGFFDPFLYGGIGSANYLEALFERYRAGRFTAMYIDNAIHARAIINYFSQHEMQPLRDYSIITVNRGTEQSCEEEPFLTQIHLPAYEHGVNIASLMVEVIENPDLEYKDVIMPYKFFYKNSVRKLNG